MIADTTQTIGPLAAEVLTRIDAVAAKMGVAAGEVWNIWIATSWRPAVGVAIGFSVALLIALVAGLALRWAVKHENQNDDLVGFLGVASCVGLIVAGIIVIFNVCNLPDAITYMAEPRLYALDQLRGLVGK